MFRILVVAIFMLGLTNLVGCGGGGLGRVTGQVTLDDKPLPNVGVTFMPAGEGGSATAITDANGNYELTHTNGKGTPVGKNKVAVTTIQKPQSTIDFSQIPSDSPEYKKAMEQAESGYNVIFTEPIPERYNAKTELEFDVKSGSQVIDLKLKSR